VKEKSFGKAASDSSNLTGMVVGGENLVGLDIVVPFP